MSIRSIDTQIMISRLTDTVRDASMMQKKPEHAQEALAAQGRIHDAEDQQKVAKTLETDMEQIRSDADGGGSGGGESGEKGKKKKEEIDPDMMVPPSNNIIDIRI